MPHAHHGHYAPVAQHQVPRGQHYGGHAQIAQFQQYHQAVQQAQARPPEPEALIVAPEPVGDHWPVDPQLLERLPPRASPTETEPSHAEALLSIQSNVPHVLHEAALLHEQDKEAERKKKRANTIAIVLLIVGIFTAVFIIGFVLIVIALIAFWRASRHGKLDLEDRRLEVVTGTLWTFASELKSNRAVKVLADFSGYENQRPVTHETTGTGLFQQTQHRYVWHHHWLLMRMTLADGTHVSVDAITKVKRKTAQKRKYEKKKDTLVEQLTIRLKPPGGKAFPVQQQLGPAQLPALQLKRGRITPRHATFVFQTAATRRMRLRGGWMAYNLEWLLDSGKVVSAIIHSYKTAARMNKRGGHQR